MRITVVGAAVMDMIMRVPRLPKPGESLLGVHTMYPGGKGANQAVAAARLGAQVHFVGTVGQDEMGEGLRSGLQASGVDCSYVRRGDAPTGIAMIAVDDNGMNTILLSEGANLLTDTDLIDETAQNIRRSDYILVQGEVPVAVTRHAMELATIVGCPVLLNPAPVQPGVEELIAAASVITPNETEAEALTGIAITDENSIVQSLTRLSGFGVPMVVITLGHRGVAFLVEDAAYLVPAFPVPPIDTTGAGDAFSAALAVALADGLTPLHAILWSSAAAALSVQRAGAQPSFAYRDEVERLILTDALRPLRLL